MNIKVKFSVDGILSHLRDYRDKAESAFAIGMAAGGQKVAAQFRDRQLSGRRSGDVGLNVVTGRLHDSIKTVTEVAEESVTSEVFNRGSTYWYWHQTGTQRLRKRLFFDEFFEEKAPDLYETEVERALRGAA